eukprot:scaffold189718_cov29-Tisochrysis_lutea.AAC.4
MTTSSSKFESWGSARTKAMHTRYRPRQAFISRSMRATRSTRKKETLISVLGPTKEASKSTDVKITMLPSSAFQPSDQYP